MKPNRTTSTREVINRGNQSALRAILTRSIECEAVWPGFQPIVDMCAGRIAGFEILARWTDPQEGDISPAEFIPRLEYHGLVDLLSDTLILRACGIAKTWPDDCFLAFNISPAQLGRSELAGHLATLSSRAGFPIDRLHLEVTEGALVADVEKSEEVLRELNALGMNVAIDDFGTGYSSLARLESFPFSKLKIDRRFVSAIDTDARKRRIVASVLGLGQSLGMSVVAEGVERRQEEATLLALGCRLGQGWLYGKAVRAEEACKLVAARGIATSLAPILDSSPFQRLHQLSAFYRAAPVGLCFVDRQFRYIDVNDRFAALHGCTSEEMLGRKIHDVMDEQTANQVEKVLLTTLTADSEVQNRYHMAGRDVLIFNARVTEMRTETDPNSVIGFTAVSVDITENIQAQRMLAERESSFRQLLEMNPDVEWTASAEGIFDYISPSASDVQGEPMRNRIDRWLGSIHPADKERVVNDWFKWIISREPYVAEFRTVSPDGSCRWIRSRARPRLNGEGKVVRWHGIASDITEIMILKGRLENHAEFR